MEELLEKIFKNAKIEIDKNYELSYNNNVFLIFRIIKKNIYVDWLGKTPDISGNEILKRLENVAKLFSAKKIILDDTSFIDWHDNVINLSIFKILINGESWYNSKGYYIENFYLFKNEWEIIRNKTFCELFYMYTYDLYLLYLEQIDLCESNIYTSRKNFEKRLIALNNSVEITKHNFNEIKKKLVDNAIISFIFNTKISVIFIMINDITLKNNINDINLITTVLNIIEICSAFIEYPAESLTKNI